MFYNDTAQRKALLEESVSIYKITTLFNPLNGYNHSNLARVYKMQGDFFDPKKYTVPKMNI